MKRTRLINLIALFVNLAIFFAFFVGFFFKFLEPCIKDFKLLNEIPQKLLDECRYYEFIAAVFTMLASFFMMFANSKSMRRMRESTPRWIFTLRYISMGMSILIIATTGLATVVNSELVDLKTYFNFTGYKFYWCVVMPALSVLCFVLLELEPSCKFRKNFGPLIAWIIYCATVLVFMFILIPKKGIEYVAKDFTPYFIFLLTKDLITASGINTTQVIIISIFVIDMVLAFILPVLLRLLNRFFSSLIIGYEYVEVDGDNNVIRPVSRPDLTYEEEEVKKVKPTKPVIYDNVYRVYVNDRKLRNWKVVLPNKSVKLFATQQEALSFAANKARKSKGTVRVHASLEKLKFKPQN